MYVLGQEEMKKPRGRPPILFKLMDERRKKREEARKEVTCETKNKLFSDVWCPGILMGLGLSCLVFTIYVL